MYDCLRYWSREKITILKQNFHLSDDNLAKMLNKPEWQVKSIRKRIKKTDTKYSKCKAGGKFDAYSNRDQILKSLGFNSYRSYQSSDLWVEIRQRVITRSNGKCECCSSKDGHSVHHIDYSIKTLLGDSIDQLIHLCKECHYIVEFAENGKKRSFDKSQAKLRRLKKVNLEVQKNEISPSVIVTGNKYVKSVVNNVPFDL